MLRAICKSAEIDHKSNERYTAFRIQSFCPVQTTSYSFIPQPSNIDMETEEDERQKIKFRFEYYSVNETDHLMKSQ